MGFAILLLDLFTGPFLMFPIFFVIPVTLSAWFCSSRLAYTLAFLLPAGRFVIAEFLDVPHSILYAVANALIRVAVLVLIAFLVGRTSMQARKMEERVNTLVRVCAWSRTVEYQGEWISFEAYLQRRFNIDTTHGISPDAAEKLLAQREETDHNA